VVNVELDPRSAAFALATVDLAALLTRVSAQRQRFSTPDLVVHAAPKGCVKAADAAFPITVRLSPELALAGRAHARSMLIAELPWPVPMAEAPVALVFNPKLLDPSPDSRFTAPVPFGDLLHGVGLVQRLQFDWINLVLLLSRHQSLHAKGD